jgi:heme/copper-type cytochrome/quinol oxidase subunit 4
MPYCPKCGNKVEENMTFCPRCGAPLKTEGQAQGAQVPPAQSASSQPPIRNEKAEKGEKQEKHQQSEKGEKHEKGGFGFVGFLIAGIVVVVLGVLAFVRVQYPNVFTSGMESALILLVIGLAIIIVGVYIAMMARRRNPTVS